MTTNTQQEKARFFAGYVGNVNKHSETMETAFLGHYSKTLSYSHLNIVARGIITDSWIELTPLSEISNEDLIQAAKIAHGTSFLNPKCKWEVDIDTEYGFKTLSAKESYHSFDFDTTYGTISMYDGDNPSGSSINHYSVFQYLQQRGYALPWYSAELGRVIEVEEQVSLGWVKLKGGEK